MLEKLSRKSLEIMIREADNYESIRFEAVKIFQSFYPNVLGISDKAKIFYNPNREYIIDTSQEGKVEKLFDIEVNDKEIDFTLLKFYKKCFMEAFNNLLNEGKLYSAERIMQWEW